MKKFIIILMVMLSVLSFVGCKKTPDAPQVEYCSVTFVQEGEQDVVKRVVKGESLTEIPNPAQRKGYVVVWDTSDFTNIRENLKVNAVKTAKTYSITLDANGGQFEDGFTTKQYVTTFASSYNFPRPTKQGYRFGGWIYEGVVYSDTKWMLDADGITLKANWGVGTPNVQFKFNNTVWRLASSGYTVTSTGVDNVSIIEREINLGEKVTLPVLEYVNDDIKDLGFLGWECNGIVLLDGEWPLSSASEPLVITPISIKTAVTFEFAHVGEFSNWQLSSGIISSNVTTEIRDGIKYSKCTIEYEYGQEVMSLPSIRYTDKYGVLKYINYWKIDQEKYIYLDDALSMGGGQLNQDNVLISGRYWGIKDQSIIVNVDTSKEPYVETPNV